MSKMLRLYCLAAGACDGATGLLLLVAPLLTLRLMGIAEAPAETIFLRWIGVFVGAVGFAYALPFVRLPFVCVSAASRLARVVAMLELTTLLRFAVGAFVTAAVATGALAIAWALVAVTDLGLGTVQILWLRRLGEANGG